VRRRRRVAEKQPLPAALPPETRTVGQLVAEAIRFYGRRFWSSLSLGVLPALAGVALAELPRWWQLAFVLTVGALVATWSYARAAALLADAHLTPRSLAVAVLAGALIFIPVPFLASVLVLPGVAWLALFGLAVPVAVIERRGLRASLSRALELARADYVHALGSLSTLTIAGFLTASAMFFLLRSGSEAALRVAAFLSVLVISPLLFLGGALLYFDQAARNEARRAPAGAPRRASS
jgi:hypothetical protein